MGLKNTDILIGGATYTTAVTVYDSEGKIIVNGTPGDKDPNNLLRQSGYSSGTELNTDQRKTMEKQVETDNNMKQKI